MNKLNEFQVERLIDLVKEKPALFNTADKYHKNFAMKEMIWKDISASIGADEKDCKTAWKSLRDQFVKAAREETTRTGLETTGRKTYKLYHKLIFLNDTLKRRMTPCKNEPSQLMDLDSSTMFSVASMPSVIPSKKRRCQEYPRNDDALKDMMSEIRSEIKAIKAPQGENDTFFMSLANMVNRAQLTPIATRHVQRRVFNFLAEELDRMEHNKYQM